MRPVGGGTKLGWGGAGPEGAVDLETSWLDEIAEHNVGDFTAVLGAGVRLADAQAAFAAEGQMLALDPPLGAADGATVGGMIATARLRPAAPPLRRRARPRGRHDRDPQRRHDRQVGRQGDQERRGLRPREAVRRLLRDARADRLASRCACTRCPALNATAIGTSEDPDRLAAAAAALAALPLEADSLDVSWDGDRGHLLVRFGGAAAAHQAEAAAERMRPLGLADARAEAEDDEIWNRQRGAAALRGRDRAQGLRPPDRPAGRDPRRRAPSAARVVSRAALGLSWLALPAGADVAAVREALQPRPVAVLDGAAKVDDAWPAPPEGTLAVMARLKERFDPARIFRPGAYVGGI